ncbi:MAG: hypothetical protein M3Y04_08380 [Actinomycetota bacterium]|nr:hypothetical protein [Actinomycetota bacterium]
MSPAVARDGTVVVGPNDDYAYGIGADGVMRWRWSKGDWSYSSAAVTPGALFVGSTSGHFFALAESAPERL